MFGENKYPPKEVEVPHGCRSFRRRKSPVCRSNRVLFFFLQLWYNYKMDFS